jgi:MYXO-CTERM domain-containing protein
VASGTSLPLDVPKGTAIYVRVVARNPGGVSFPSEVVGARRSYDGEVPVLLVSAFDRLDGGQLSWDDLPGVGTTHKMTLEHINPQDAAAVHGRSIDALGWPFDAMSDESFATADLSRYKLVVWMTGEESTDDESFSTVQQQKIRAYVEGGGALWTSGAETLWDLDYRGSADDKTFALDILGATMASDASDTFVADGADILSGLTVRFGVEDGAAYPVEWADVLGTARTPILNYDNGGVAAALGDHVATFGFPFETIGDPTVRDEVVARLLPALLPGYEPGVEPGDTDEDTDLVDTSLGGGPWPRRPLSELGCGCSSGGHGGMILALAGALLLRRRR